MNRLGPVDRWRVAFATLLVGSMALGGAALYAPESEAAAGKNCEYYSDASHGTLVGRFGRDCCNNTIAWGTKTAFSECSSGCLVCVPPAP
jgi:hypothetical protein